MTFKSKSRSDTIRSKQRMDVKGKPRDSRGFFLTQRPLELHGVEKRERKKLFNFANSFQSCLKLFMFF